MIGVQSSTGKAFRQAGVTCSDIDIVEPHTAYTIMGAVSLEAMGFAPKGRAGHLAEEGYVSLSSISKCILN